MIQNTSDWKSDIRTALRSFDEVKNYFELDFDYDGHYKSFIPKSFAQKIKNYPKDSALWKQFIPNNLESSPLGLTDPIGDKKMAQGHGIIQRYKSRILYTPTTFCPIACRYCFRKNELNENDQIFSQNLSYLKNYLKKNSDISEVILTGGDPLVISNEKLKEIFDALFDCKIKYVRLHTRTPVIIPKRIDKGFVDLLDEFSIKFNKIILALHTNHVDELDESVSHKLLLLKDIPIKKLTQTVFLKDINDSKQVLLNLFHKVLELDFTPYYLHHPDKALGAMHFYFSLQRGREIYNQLRDELPGWAIPHYIIDHSSGSGKQFAFNPESYQFSGKLLNKTGELLTYE